MSLQARLLVKYHDRQPTKDGVVYYPPKVGMEKEAAAAWKLTGVCLACYRRAVTKGRCVECGKELQ
jgi:hypothetical protein